MQLQLAKQYGAALLSLARYDGAVTSYQKAVNLRKWIMSHLQDAKRWTRYAGL